MSSLETDGNSTTIQFLTGSITLITPESFKRAMKCKSSSSSNVVTVMGRMESMRQLELVVVKQFRIHSVRLSRELDVATRQFGPELTPMESFVPTPPTPAVPVSLSNIALLTFYGGISVRRGREYMSEIIELYYIR